MVLIFSKYRANKKTSGIPVVLLLTLILLSGCLTKRADEKAVGQPPNVLFIAIDDLQNDLGALGVDYVYTPYLDSFAKESRLFTHHYITIDR